MRTQHQTAAMTAGDWDRIGPSCVEICSQRTQTLTVSIRDLSLFSQFNYEPDRFEISHIRFVDQLADVFNQTASLNPVHPTYLVKNQDRSDSVRPLLHFEGLVNTVILIWFISNCIFWHYLSKILEFSSLIFFISCLYIRSLSDSACKLREQNWIWVISSSREFLLVTFQLFDCKIRLEHRKSAFFGVRLALWSSSG